MKADVPNKLAVLPGSVASLDVMMAMVRQEYPGAVHGVVIVFDEDGTMHTHYRANYQEVALASVRLAHLANE